MSIVGDGRKLVIDFENYRYGQDSVSKNSILHSKRLVFSLRKALYGI